MANEVQPSITGKRGINEDVAADYSPAGRITVTELDREGVVGTWVTIVDHIDGETGFLLSGTGGSGDVSMVTNDVENGNGA